MKSFFVPFLLLLVPFVGMSQDFETMLSVRPVDCREISYNSSLHYVRLMQEDKIDSVYSLLDFWEKKCGDREPIMRAKILLALTQGTFSENLLPEKPLDNVFAYQTRMRVIGSASYSTYDEYPAYFGFVPPGQEFDNYTRDLAKALKDSYPQETLEYLFAEFYGDNADTIISKLKSEPFASSRLGMQYKENIENYINLPEGHYSFNTGIWMPTGHLRKMGNHPEFGFQMGVKHLKMNYDLTMGLAFVKSKESYYAYDERIDSTYLTDHFMGFNIGVDFGRDIFNYRKHEIQAIVGIAYAGIENFKSDNDNDDDTDDSNDITSGTYDLNFGFEYRYYLNGKTYLGIRPKYHIVDYTLSDIIDFTGNPVTVSIIIGFVNNIYKENNLKNLRYRYRQ